MFYRALASWVLGRAWLGKSNEPISLYAISTKIKRVARLRPLCPLLKIIPLASPGRILKEAISPTSRARSMMGGT